MIYRFIDGCLCFVGYIVLGFILILGIPVMFFLDLVCKVLDFNIKGERFFKRLYETKKR